MTLGSFFNTSIIDQIALLLFSILICSSLICQARCQVKGSGKGNLSITKTLIINDNDNKEHMENSKLASLIAQNAALIAKEVSDVQSQAGVEAALKVKEELTKRAEDGAKAAQAALAGKQGIVDELKKIIKFTEGLIKEGSYTGQAIIQDAKVVTGVSQQVENMIKQLQELIKIATQAQTNEQNVGCIVQKDADSKTTRLEGNCQRYTKLTEKLKTARVDLEETMRLIKCNWL